MRNPFRVAIITGIPGVGKTTVLQLVEEKARDEEMNIFIANYGTYMIKTATKEGIAKDRDELRKLRLRDQLELQKLAAENMIEDAAEKLESKSKGYLLIDTHSIIKTIVGYWPGLPKHVTDVFKPDLIVLIEANPKVIHQRQVKDITRKRSDFGGPEAIRELRDFARYSAIASAVFYGSAVAIVENPEGHPETAASKIMELLRNI
ncbi:MAG: adenylate kinase [Desulfurococcales archaeon]|nr:adenylate kinase [Desulfurococcales archaeon]